MLHINTTDQGGAAKACIRIHLSLVSQGIDSYLLTKTKTRNDIPNHHCFNKPKKNNTKNSYLTKAVNSLVKKIAFNRNRLPIDQEMIKKKVFEYFNAPFSFIESEYDITGSFLFDEVDIINLHWTAGYLDWNTFFSKMGNKKMVWSLHDMNPFTGGYHYANGYEGYTQSDQNFPPLQKTLYAGIANKQLLQKKSLLKDIDLKIVGDSNWLSGLSKSSSLFGKFDTTTIYYGIETDIYKPLNKKVCRQILGLPEKADILLFAAQHVEVKRKGFHLLLESINALDMQDFVLCSFGSYHEQSFTSNMKHIHLGYISDDRMAAVVYNAADVFIIPSLEEAFGQTTIESQCCGTPVIGFPVGGIKESIEHGKNGYLCEEVSSDSLAKTIQLFFNIKNAFDSERISRESREKYSYERCAEQYLKVYNSFN